MGVYWGYMGIMEKKMEKQFKVRGLGLRSKPLIGFEILGWDQGSWFRKNGEWRITCTTKRETNWKI